MRLSSLRDRPGLENPLSRLALYVDEMPRIHTLARRLKHIDPVILAARERESLEMLDRFFVRRTEIAMLLDRTREVPRCSDTEKYLEMSQLHRMGKVRRQFINKRDGGKTEAVGRVENLL